MRLHVYEDQPSWMAVTSSLGPRGSKLRKLAVSAWMRQLGDAAPRGRLATWVASQSLAAILRKQDGGVLIWAWKDDPELLFVVASLQRATPELRVARAMMPMSEDDTEDFPHPTLGMGERLIVDKSGDGQIARVSYTFDLTTHLVQVAATSGDPLRMRTALTELDALVRDLRVTQDLPVGETPTSR